MQQGHDVIFLIHDGEIDSIFKPFLKIDQAIHLQRNILEKILGLYLSRKDISNVEADLYLQFQLSPNRVITNANTFRLLRIHDVLPITNPEWFKLRSKISFRIAFRNIPDFAGFIFNSKHTKKEFEKLYPAKKEFKFVLPCRFDSQRIPQKCERCQACRYLQVTTGPFMLSVGTLEPRKNYLNLISAFEESGIQSHQLIIVGTKGWKFRLKNYDEKSIKFLKDTCDGSLSELMQKSDCYVSVTYAEGFNIPIRVAKLKKKNIIASDIPIHREIEGSENFIFVDPRSVKSIKNGLYEFLNSKLSNYPDHNKDNFENELANFINHVSKLVRFQKDDSF